MTEAGASRRRIVAIVLPDLLCELSRQHHPSWQKGSRAEPPFGVLLVESCRAPQRSEPALQQTEAGTSPTLELAAVNEGARRYGVRPGQTVTEAHAFVTQLLVEEITRAEVQSRLGEIAEVGMAFGPTVSIRAPDTVWVDVTGASHLSGGEERLALEIGARVTALGHRARVAIGSGPRLARALARWGKLSADGARVGEDSDVAIAGLPVKALPMDPELVTWLTRLGVHTLGDLRKLPREVLGPRLGPLAGDLLDMAAGKDVAPLVAYVPPPMPREETTWEDPASGSEPLLFVLRGLTSRLSLRLEGRGEAVQALDLVIAHDAAVSRLEGMPLTTTLHFELAAPLYRQAELYRVLSSRVSRQKLPAPSIGIRLEAKAITRALALQLSLSRQASGLGGDSHRGPETLPVLLAELTSDLGKERVGVLENVNSHRPEKKSRLVSISPDRAWRALAPSRGGKKRRSGSDHTVLADAGADLPTRLFEKPIPFDAPLRRGSTVSLGHRFYTVESVTFERRLEAVEWWTSEPVSRDYVRVWLSGARGGLEALVYKDRATGSRWLHGIWD